MNKVKLQELAQQAEQLLRQLEYVRRYQKLDKWFPEDGPLRRELYGKHIDFFNAGKQYATRLFMAANQVGKSSATLYELTLHVTGLYPKWWTGHRFDKPIKCWAVGHSSDTVKQIIQPKLLGDVGDFGTGFIPRHCLDFESLTEAKKAGTLINNLRVKHSSGGYSTIEIKTYESGRRTFEGQSVDLIVIDEEPPMDIYGECLARTVATSGKIIMNFTPLLGMSEVISQFTNGGDWSEGEKSPYNYLVNCQWEDVPHLSEDDKARLIASMPDYLKDARTKGIPMLGAGAVYPVSEHIVFIEPIKLPQHWKRVFAMDFGWTAPTAILWGAVNPDDHILYVYSEHYVKEQPPFFHAQAIKTRNDSVGYKIPGVCDPSGGGRGIHDGKKAREIMKDEFDIIMEGANNSVEPGIMKVNEWLATGRIKIFNNLVSTVSEYRMFRRDTKGKPVGNDHLMDCLRYMVMSGFDLAQETDAINDKAEAILNMQRNDEYNAGWADNKDSWYYNH